MAIWGSAPTVRLSELKNFIGGGIGLLGKVISHLFSDNFVINPFETFNWEDSDKRLKLHDAGITINLPLPPLFEPDRHIDVIIVLDLSADCFEHPQSNLDKFAKWAAKVQHPDAANITKTVGPAKVWRKSRTFKWGEKLIVWLPLAIAPISTYLMTLNDKQQEVICNEIKKQWDMVKNEFASELKKYCL